MNQSRRKITETREASTLAPFVGRPLSVMSAEFDGRDTTLTLQLWDSGKSERVRIARRDRAKVLDAIVTGDGRYASGLVFDPRRFN